MSTDNVDNFVSDPNKGDDGLKGNENETRELTKEEKERHLMELVGNGRRAIRVNDIDEAVDLLSQATELSVELYGENHENTFEPHYYYGMAALEQAKLESQLLKNPNSKEIVNEEDVCPESTDDKSLEANEKSDESEKEDGEESGEEDDDSMRHAWEILEVARCIAFVKIEKLEAERSGISAIEEWNLKLADVLVILGEHGFSDGKYDQALEDLDGALNIQQNFLPHDSRKIAQTLVLSGDVCASSMKYEEAISFYNRTKECLLLRQTNLKQQFDMVEDVGQKAEIEDDLKELEEMIPGVDSKIADSSSSAEQLVETKKAIESQYAGIKTIMMQLPQDNSQNKEANDISSLVRRPVKRQTAKDEDGADEAKKVKDGDDAKP